MISRMRILSSPTIVECADKIMRATIDTYFAPNKTIRELHELVKSGSTFDPLKDFSEMAREELLTFLTSRVRARVKKRGTYKKISEQISN